MTTGHSKTDTVEDTGHVWDGDLTELNNPLPRWWLGLFYITIVFSGFLPAALPGSRASSAACSTGPRQGAYEEEVAAMDAKVGPLFARYQQTSMLDLTKDETALKVGERLYANYCTTCHGSDARGARGYPNLRDGDWLWGGSPAEIKTTIMQGRQAAMPAWEAVLGGERGVDEVAQYVLSLSGRATISELAAQGKTKYEMFCVACHGADGTGNTALGAPNLTDNTWLYGGSLTRISQSIAVGRNGKMPAQGEFLGEAKVHLLSAYIYSLSQQQ